jgi:hypothetical protein
MPVSVTPELVQTIRQSEVLLEKVFQVSLEGPSIKERELGEIDALGKNQLILSMMSRPPGLRTLRDLIAQDSRKIPSTRMKSNELGPILSKIWVY